MLSDLFHRFSPLQRSYISATAALLGYGAWAFLVNSMHGVGPALKAAFVQGGYSCCITFVMTLLIEGLFRLFLKQFSNLIVAKSLTAILVCAIIFNGSWWLNVLAGTPEVFNTVILGYIIGGIYTFSYTFGLRDTGA